MKMTVIYDETGKIFYCATEDIVKPLGLPYIEVDVPSDKLLKCIDVSSAEPTPVFEDIPKSGVETSLEELREEVNLLNDVLLEQMGV